MSVLMMDETIRRDVVERMDERDRRRAINRHIEIEIRAREMWWALSQPKGRDEEIWIAAEVDIDR